MPAGMYVSFMTYLFQVNLFHAINLFLYHLETSENVSDVFRGYTERPLAWNTITDSGLKLIFILNLNGSSVAGKSDFFLCILYFSENKWTWKVEFVYLFKWWTILIVVLARKSSDVTTWTGCYNSYFLSLYLMKELIYVITEYWRLSWNTAFKPQLFYEVNRVCISKNIINFEGCSAV